MYRLQQLRLEARQALHESQAQLLLTPTVGATYTIQERWDVLGICGKTWMIRVEWF